MFVGDFMLQQVLQEELDALRQDPALIADLIADAPVELQRDASRWFGDLKNPIKVVLSSPVEPLQAPLIMVQLAGEQETDTPLGGVAGQGVTPDATAATLSYQAGPQQRGLVTIAPDHVTLEVVQDGSPRFTAARHTFAFTDYPTLTGLASAIDATAGWLMVVERGYESARAQTLAPGSYELPRVGEQPLPALGDVYVRRYGTWFQGTWKFTALAPNAYLAVWLQGFIKWALLRRRIDLHRLGLVAHQLQGGELEPVGELGPDFIYARGLVLMGKYFCQWTLGDPVFIAGPTQVTVQS